MDFISHFDPTKAQEAHGGTILASDVLPAGLLAPFDHAWGYLNGPGAMEPHTHLKKKYTSSQKETAMSLWTERAILLVREM